MLVELNIRNFALIDELRLEVGPGFGVLTGETGTGKSIIVDAMAAALGEKIGPDAVRTGASRAVLEAVFDLSDAPAAAAAASELGYEAEGGVIVLSREIAAEGRSQCRINGRPAAVSALREITSRLVDIHGQHEHQSLLSAATHVDILDAWAGDETAALRAEVRKTYAQLCELLAEQQRLRTDDHERARLLDLYSFQIKEIQRAELAPGEEEELSQERTRLANAERLRALAEQVFEALEGDGAAIDRLSQAALALEKLADTDSACTPATELLEAAIVNTQEALDLLRGYRDDYDLNPTRLEEIEDRLDLIRTLKRKYGDTIEQVLRYAEDSAEKLNSLQNSEERLGELDSEISRTRAEMQALCARLTKVRKKAAAGFEKSVERELADLAMEKSRFQVSITEAEPGPTGADTIEFLISPNPGEPVKPLVTIASGGEMSRVMLALKTVMTRLEVPTLVFDEIDSGIGGRTAHVLGEKLASLGQKCQVLCVTHLPQIASKATRHAVVEKTPLEGRTVVRVRMVDAENRVNEIARMLGGNESAAAADHAREMLSLANQRNS